MEYTSQQQLDVSCPDRLPLSPFQKSTTATKIQRLRHFQNTGSFAPARRYAILQLRIHRPKCSARIIFLNMNIEHESSQCFSFSSISLSSLVDEELSRLAMASFSSRPLTAL